MVPSRPLAGLCRSMMLPRLESPLASFGSSFASPRESRRSAALLGGCWLALGLACSDNTTVIGAEPGAEIERADSATVVAVLTRLPDDTFQTYLLASEGAPSGTLDLSGALELPDALVAQNEDAIFIGDNERIALQRYEVNADYSFAL